MAKVAFIEDQTELKQAISSILKREGFEVVTADDGEAGIDLIKKELPNVVLLDLILPKKDGFEVLDEIKKNDVTKNIPIIVLTNLEGTKEIEEVISLGAAAYLVKTNYRLEEVVEKVKSVLKE